MNLNKVNWFDDYIMLNKLLPVNSFICLYSFFIQTEEKPKEEKPLPKGWCKCIHSHKCMINSLLQQLNWDFIGYCLPEAKVSMFTNGVPGC